MIFPLPCFFMYGKAALAHSHEPRTFTAIALSNSSTAISQNGLFFTFIKYAALLTSTSTPPNCLATSSTMALRFSHRTRRTPC